MQRSEMQGQKTDEVRPHRASLLFAYRHSNCVCYNRSFVRVRCFTRDALMHEVATRRQSVTVSFRLQNSLAEVVHSMFIRDACVRHSSREAQLTCQCVNDSIQRIASYAAGSLAINPRVKRRAHEGQCACIVADGNNRREQPARNCRTLCRALGLRLGTGAMRSRLDEFFLLQLCTHQFFH